MVANTRLNVDRNFLWTVKFDADGKVLKRHEHEVDVDHRDSKRVRFTHKQLDKRADMELTDDTVVKCAKMFNTSSSSSSSHEVAPNLHDSSGEICDPETREILCRNLEWVLMWKSVPLRRSHTPSWKLIEHWTRQTRRCIACWKKFHLNLRQSPRPQNSTASETSESTLRCTRAKPTPRLSAAKWVLKPHKARYVLRGFEEDLKDEYVFASTTMTACLRMLLSQATDLRNEGYTLFTVDVKTAFLNGHVKDGDVWYAKPPPDLTLACGPTRRREYHSYSTWTTCCWLERTRLS